jgi:hypothetical protein
MTFFVAKLTHTNWNISQSMNLPRLTKCVVFFHFPVICSWFTNCIVFVYFYWCLIWRYVVNPVFKKQNHHHHHHYHHHHTWLSLIRVLVYVSSSFFFFLVSTFLPLLLTELTFVLTYLLTYLLNYILTLLLLFLRLLLVLLLNFHPFTLLCLVPCNFALSLPKNY